MRCITERVDAEPGICRGNEDSRGNENRGTKCFPWEKIDFF